MPKPAKAAGFSLYSKAGFIDLKETVNGQQYVREQGAVSEVGVLYDNNLAGIDVAPSFGVWGAVLKYEGSNLDTSLPTSLNSTTGFYGAKVNLPASKLFELSPDFSVGPLVSVDANYFVRTVGERWLVLSAKSGIKAEVYSLEMSAGALYPFYTVDTIYGWPTDSFTVHPKGMVTGFADLKYKAGKSWSLGAYFEMWRWSASENVHYNYTGNNTNSAIATGSSAYQPETVIINVGFSVDYRF